MGFGLLFYDVLRGQVSSRGRRDPEGSHVLCALGVTQEVGTLASVGLLLEDLLAPSTSLLGHRGQLNLHFERVVFDQTG